MSSSFARATLIIVSAMSLALTAPAAHAAPDAVRVPGKIGVGIGSGTLANGLSAKWYLAYEHALQFNLGVYGGGGIHSRWAHAAGFAFSVDYLFELPDIATVGRAFVLGWNVGAGGGIGVSNGHAQLAVAASFVLGLELRFIPAPLDLVIEYRPGLLIVPEANFDPVDFTAHLRFYF